MWACVEEASIPYSVQHTSQTRDKLSIFGKWLSFPLFRLSAHSIHEISSHQERPTKYRLVRVRLSQRLKLFHGSHKDEPQQNRATAQPGTHRLELSSPYPCTAPKAPGPALKGILSLTLSIFQSRFPPVPHSVQDTSQTLGLQACLPTFSFCGANVQTQVLTICQ